MAKISNLSCDIETYSSVDLRKSGVYRYAEADDFEVLLFAYSVDGGAVHVVDLANGEEIPKEIKDALIDENVTKWAFNATFERVCLSRLIGLPEGEYLSPSSWKCTMVWSAYLGLPLSLEGAAIVTGADKQKLSEGKDLIRFFSIPCRPTKTNGGRTRNLPSHAPERWENFKAYNKRDVETEIAIQARLSKFPMPNEEWNNYILDQIINDTGVKLDMDLVEKAIQGDEIIREKVMERMQAITQLENPNSVMQLRGWLKTKGVVTDSLNKASVQELLETTTGDVHEVLQLRQQLAKSSVKKYTAMENVICNDERARGLIQFYGANRTGRFAGRLIQVQNLPRNYLPDLEQARNLARANQFDALEMLYDSVPDVLSQLIRTAFIPKKGHKFIIADFSSIERVVLAWLAGEKWVLDAYRRKEDLYIATASQMFDVPIEKINKKDPLRDKGKVADLACIAEGELVLTDKGLVPIERITLEHKLWDGGNFVNHDGVIYKGVKEVISYGGLTATEDHLVWVEGKSEPVQFKEAASSGAHLLQTGDGWKTIRLGENNQSREKMEQESQLLQGINPMCKLQANTMDASKQPAKWLVKRLPTMLPTKTNSIMAGPQINCSETKMRKPKCSRLFKLRRTRDPVQIQFSSRSRTLDNRKLRSAEQKSRNRQNRQRWPLRARKHPICNKARKLCEQKDYSFSRMASNRMALCKNGCNKEVISRYEKRRNYRRCEKSSTRKKKELAANFRTVRVYDILNAGPNHRFTVSNVLVHNCGYGGSVGALKAMGALDMGLSEEELKPLVDSWRVANPKIVSFWWDVDRATKETVRKRQTHITHGIQFEYQSGMMFIKLPSRRRLAYVKPRLGINSFGNESVSYEGIGATKKWERIDSYGPKFVENIVQAISRDLLCHALQRVHQEGFRIVMHVHDEIVVEALTDSTVEYVSNLMTEPPSWAKGLALRADGFETEFYKKD